MKELYLFWMRYAKDLKLSAKHREDNWNDEFLDNVEFMIWTLGKLAMFNKERKVVAVFSSGQDISPLIRQVIKKDNIFIMTKPDGIYVKLENDGGGPDFVIVPA